VSFERRCLALAIVAGFLCLPTSASAQPGKVKFLLQKAEQYEKSYEWDKAFAVYEEILKSQRDRTDIKERQLAALRRYWQELRHRDLSYRKEVLSLDYGQALQVHGVVFDTLLEATFQKTKLTPGKIFRRGIEELETALADPSFLQNHLMQGSPSSIQTFRAFLAKKRDDSTKFSRRDCQRAVREVALAAQNALQLNPTVAIMECACGSCYALDEYTAYLTPTQFRDLSDVFKGPMALMASVQAFPLPKAPEIGYIQITLFQESTPQEIDAAFAELTKSGAKGLILDLRGNSGGYLESAVEVARRFVASGVIASTENFDPKLSTVYHSRNPDAWAVPLVVLVDSDTASAAEVLAGALKENGRARIIGQPTFGKGFSQALVKLPDAVGNVPTGGLRLTIARFFSPKGLPYAGQGVAPDITIPRVKPDGMDPLEDQQLAEAIADLHRQLAMR
jgi:hypothetical protein